MMANRPVALAFAALVVALLAVGCSGPDPDSRFPKSRGPGETSGYESRDTVFGSGGVLDIFGGKKKQPEDGSSGGIGVNAFLWRATLDTVSFMPITTADPFGGVVITDWYALPETPTERFKMNVYILGRELRADAVRASVFRQVQDKRGDWRDADVAADANTKIEDAILAKARQLRFAVTQ
jgi:hypothetical protein